MRSLASVERSIQKSARHPLHRQALHPVPGEGPAHARLVLVGEAPGRTEDATGRPFVGRSGRLLDAELRRAGIDRRRVFITSVLKYFPRNGKVARPDIDLSLPWLADQIRAIRPKVVLLMGNVARSVRGRLPSGPRYLETVHPAAALRFPNYRRQFRQALRRLRTYTMPRS